MNTPSPLEGDERYLLGVMSGKIDLVLVQLATIQATNDARFAKNEDSHASLETRVDTLEKQRSWLMGGAAAIGATSGLIAKALGFKFGIGG